MEAFLKKDLFVVKGVHLTIGVALLMVIAYFVFFKK